MTIACAIALAVWVGFLQYCLLVVNRRLEQLVGELAQEALSKRGDRSVHDEWGRNG